MPSLTIIITNVPDIPVMPSIYLASNINQWKSNDGDFRFQKEIESGYYILKLTNVPDEIAFKFTRGSWQTEETDINNKVLTNREWNKASEQAVYIATIHNWKDLPALVTKPAIPKATLWLKDFYLPQLERTRNVWLYLPPNYHENRSFPVIYMHDAQNVFDGLPSPYGKWEVPEALNNIYKKTGWSCIIIAVEHGNELRHAEYSPWPHKTRGGGEGKKYMDFIVNTLKPVVDQQFKTLADAQNTCIMGSSMGGLISMYAALQYGEVFGKVGVFSPAFWWCEKIYEFAANQPFNYIQKLVLLAGGQENESIIPDTLAMYNTLIDNNYFEDKINLDFFEWGQHSESFWALEFDKALRFLFEEQMELTVVKAEQCVIYNSEKAELMITIDYEKFELLNAYGKIILQKEASIGNMIALQPHWKGSFIYKCYLKSGKIITKNIHLR
jgi:alpha-glucosidase